MKSTTPRSQQSDLCRQISRQQDVGEAFDPENAKDFSMDDSGTSAHWVEPCGAPDIGFANVSFRNRSEALLTPTSRLTNPPTPRAPSPMAEQPVVRYVIPFPTPGTPGAPYFAGADVTEFLEHFEDLGKDHGLTEQRIAEVVPRYCERKIRDIIKAQEAWKIRSWEELMSDNSGALLTGRIKVEAIEP